MDLLRKDINTLAELFSMESLKSPDNILINVLFVKVLIVPCFVPVLPPSSKDSPFLEFSFRKVYQKRSGKKATD